MAQGPGETFCYRVVARSPQGRDRAMTTRPRLAAAMLDRLPAGVLRPSYDRSAVATGIVHLGIGAFHRAHQAVMTDAVLARGDLRWGTLGASLRSPETRDALAPQDGLYTVAVRDEQGERLQVVGSVGTLMVAPENPQALLAAMASPTVGIVSLTVTEKGYCHAPATGDLDERHPDIVHDLAHPKASRSAPGLIVEALRLRRAAGVPAFTALCCDNLPHNGATLKRVLVRFATLRDLDLGRFVAGELRCPSTMVDRIVPATTDADREAIAGKLGFHDAWPVLTEPFSQWVVEDDFAAGRPDWDAVGATFVSDVAPFELAKLRLLNGSHSALAYLGNLAGHETVADTMAAPGFAAVCARPHARGSDPHPAPSPRPRPRPLCGVARGAVPQPGTPPPDVADRHGWFAEAAPAPARHDQGSDRGGCRSFERLALGVAAWMRYATARDDMGRSIDLRDPLADELRRRTAGIHDAGALIDALLGLDSVFAADLPAEPRFRAAVEAALSELLESGAAATVARRSSMATTRSR